MGGKGSGDVLARGMPRANFGSMCHIPADKWNAIFGKSKRKGKKKK